MTSGLISFRIAYDILEKDKNKDMDRWRDRIVLVLVEVGVN